MQSLLQLTDTQISTWVASFMLPLFRVASMLMVMPVFGTTLIPRRVRLYFAVAIKPEAEAKSMAIDRSFRNNGLLFQTVDPKEALRNVLMLGARDAELRKIIAKL